MLTLEEFGTGIKTPGQIPDIGSGTTDNLGSFDEGYQAGWDDAILSVQEEHAAISTELGRNLEELSVTFFEARRQVCRSLRPFVEAISDVVLPEIVKDNVAAALARYVDEILGDDVPGNAVLVVSEADLETISKRIPKQERMTVEVRVEPSFAPGQIRLLIGEECHEIDHSRLLESVRTAVSDFYSGMAEDSKVG